MSGFGSHRRGPGECLGPSTVSGYMEVSAMNQKEGLRENVFMLAPESWTSQLPEM